MTGPAMIAPEMTVPEMTVPGMTGPETTVPEMTVPGMTGPETTVPAMTGHAMTDPGLTATIAPATSGPEMIGPGMIVPGMIVRETSVRATTAMTSARVVTVTIDHALTAIATIAASGIPWRSSSPRPSRWSPRRRPNLANVRPASCATPTAEKAMRPRFSRLRPCGRTGTSRPSLAAAGRQRLTRRRLRLKTPRPPGSPSGRVGHCDPGRERVS